MKTEHFYARAIWQCRLAYLPKTCDISGDKIWLEYAFRGRIYLHGLAGEDPIIEERWLSKMEFLIARLKNMVRHVSS